MIKRNKILEFQHSGNIRSLEIAIKLLTFLVILGIGEYFLIIHFRIYNTLG